MEINMKQYVMGIDNGGSSVKAALFDLKGMEIAVAASNYSGMVRTDQGFTERDGSQVWKENCNVIREVLQTAGIEGQQVIGIGVTGYGNGLHLVDAQGQDTYPHIVSTDSRAKDDVEQAYKSGVSEQIYRQTFQSTWAAQPLMLLKWMKAHRPDVVAKTKYFLNIKDYIRLRLTDVFCMERTDASADGFLNIESGEPDPKVFELLGIAELQQLVPEIRPSAEICGHVTEQAAKETGLAQGTPVAGGMIDIEACAFASGLLQQGELAVVTGTWSLVEYLSPAPIDDKELFINALSYLPEYYLVVEGSSTSAGNYDWVMEHMFSDWVKAVGGKGNFYQLCEQILEKISPEECSCIFLPYLYASNTNPLSRGAFFNLNSYHTREHLIRSVQEGIVFSGRYHLEKLQKYQKDFSLVHMSGGITNSAMWTQMMCDVLQIPIEVVQGKQQGAKGAAMCAGVAAGAFADITEAVRQMTVVEKRYLPDPSRAEVYRRKYERYKAAAKAVNVFTESIKNIG